MFARIKQRRSLIVGIVVVLALAGLAIAPWVIWHLTPNRPLDVLIVDKTVAKPNYREHAGIHWLLRHEKITQRATGKPLVLDRDYAGAQHTPDGERTVVPIPSRPTDLVYIADTYGIYEDDLKSRSLGVKSPLLYGGLSTDEVATITSNLRPGATLVAEFNCIASPTVGVARKNLSDALGIHWTGWIGRHFAFLDLTVDMPLWIPRTWKRQTGQQWRFRGPGYVFVNEEGYLIVLVEGIDTPTPALRVTTPEPIAKKYGIARRQTYDYWFEVLEPLPGAEVLSTFEIELTPTGKEKMRGVPIDKPFPAILRTQHPTHLSYYFAGDFNDRPVVDSAYRYKWLPKIKAVLGEEHRDDLEMFYWRVYVPLMQHIVDEAAGTSRSRSPDDGAR